MRLIRPLLLALAVAGSLAAALVAWLFGGQPAPGDVDPVAVRCSADAPELPRGKPLKVLIWNVQFAGSRRHWFFYDGGVTVAVPPDDVTATLDEIARVVAEHQPDLVLLQEVDRGSARTGRVDQHAELLRRVPFPCDASTPYHQVAYVPHPGHEHMGRVDLHLSVFSKYRLDSATRTQLALMVEPWWKQVFNLRRALMEVRLPLQGGGELRAFNTHLSAFSMGDGTLDRQMAALDAAMTTAEQAKVPFLLGGDLNALPPGDNPARLGSDADQYAEAVTPAQRLFARFPSVVTPAMFAAEPERWRTYLPYGASAADRTLDYAFIGRQVELGEVTVLQETGISDHLPILVTITP